MKNWKLLTLAAPAVLVMASSLSLNGCTICDPDEDPDCEFDGFGGDDGMGGNGATDGSGGSGASSSTGGMAGGDTGGTGGEDMTIDCGDVPTGTPGEAEAPVGDCQVCIEDKCGAEQAACNSRAPFQACGWGTATLDGEEEPSEASCMLSCFDDLNQSGDFVGDQADINTCAAKCGALACGGPANAVTEEFSQCILGLSDPMEPEGCQVECGLF